MNFKYYLSAVAVMASLSLATVSCSDDENNTDNTENTDNDGENNGGNNGETLDNVKGEVSGVWTKNSTINVTGHITVPEGKSLTIEEGVQVIFSTQGVGTSHAAIEFAVKGNLYSLGTKENPVRMSVAKDERTAENIFNEDHMWGGIVAYPNCAEMIIDNTIIEYTGGQVIEGSPAEQAEIYVAGDDAYPQITTNNPDGKYVITNNTIRYGWSDGIYMMGGNAIIAGNTFAANGYDGAEAVNVKAGCVVDVAGNIMYAPNTNGLKLSSKGQGESGRLQGKIKAYNNTIFNAGWRRDGEKGGSVWAECNVRADVFNNMMVNCKFRAQTNKYKEPNDVENGYDSHSTIDYNCYISGSQKSDCIWAGDAETEATGIAYAWQGYNWKHKNYHTEAYTCTDGTVVPGVDSHSVIATQDNLPNPAFVNYDINTASMKNVVYNENWDFHTTNVIAGAYSGNDEFAQPYWAAGLVVKGVTYKSPAVEAHFGAFGAAN